jgi:hypothetical protein
VRIELDKLLEQVVAGRQPESGATVAQLLDQYVQVAEWDVSTGWALRVTSGDYYACACRPLKAATMRQIHSIVSGAFAAARGGIGSTGTPRTRPGPYC